jgi:hypothetical protein
MKLAMGRANQESVRRLLAYNHYCLAEASGPGSRRTPSTVARNSSALSGTGEIRGASILHSLRHSRVVVT